MVVKRWILGAALFVGGVACATGQADTNVAAAPEQEDHPWDGVPDIDPTETISVRGERIDVYAYERDGEYRTKVCIRFQETGSRVWRNSCNRASSNNVVTANNRGFTFRDLGRRERLNEDAVYIAQTANDMLNGSVALTDLGKELEAELRKSWPNNERRPDAFGPSRPLTGGRVP